MTPDPAYDLARRSLWNEARVRMPAGVPVCHDRLTAAVRVAVADTGPRLHPRRAGLKGKARGVEVPGNFADPTLCKDVH